MGKEKVIELLEIRDQIERQFTKTEWLELGYLIGCDDIIKGHDRLLRSLSWGDEDYSGNVLEVLSEMLKRDSKNLDEIKSFLATKFSTPVVSEFISTAHTEAPKKNISFTPQVFNIPDKPQNEKLVAVMLPFALNKTFDAIKKACDDLGLECKKADDIWQNSTFIQDIFELIFTCQVVVVDFSNKNPNVFYEVGIAHTLGKTVIPLTQSIDDVPSDLRHHRVLKYLPNAEGYSDMIEELKKRLKTVAPVESIDWL